MCRRINCATCGRPSFAGCGAHVEQVLADVTARVPEVAQSPADHRVPRR